GTDEGDYQIKMRNINRFLADGDKVKVTLRFRGREMAHQQLGAQLLERVKEDLAEVAQIESFPKMEGRQMVMMIAPKKK
ncbi:TPA: translation initiation factor IF-3, partial [Neisseria gonorrhoeae]